MRLGAVTGPVSRPPGAEPRPERAARVAAVLRAAHVFAGGRKIRAHRRRGDGATYDDPPTPSEGRARELLERAEQVGGLGSWDWRPADGDLLWSDNLFRLFGYEPGAVAPSTDLVVEHAHPDDRERVARALERVAVDGLRYRVVRTDGTIRHVAVTIAEAGPRDAPGRRLVGSVQDVTEHHRSDREIALRIAVSEALERWSSFEPGALELLKEMGGALGALFAVLWVPREGAAQSRVVWFDPRREAQGETMATAALERGPVLANPALRRGRPSVARARGSISEPGSPRSSLTIPARHGEEVLAILEFHVDEELEPSERLLRSLTGVGYEIGHFLHRRRGEIAPGPLTDREVEVLQLAADGMPARAIADELSISPATVKRHFEGIYARLDVTDRAAAVAEAMRRGLVD